MASGTRKADDTRFESEDRPPISLTVCTRRYNTMNRTLRAFALAMFVALGVSHVAFAQTDTEGHTVTMEVAAINVLAITGDVTLTIDQATPGSDPDPVSGSASYAVTTNESAKKITAEIDTNLPANMSLVVDAAAPLGATGSTDVALTETASDVVTGMSTIAASGLALNYTFSATAAAGKLVSTGYTVTYTITN